MTSRVWVESEAKQLAKICFEEVKNEKQKIANGTQLYILYFFGMCAAIKSFLC
jgi:hypothetical protein